MPPDAVSVCRICAGKGYGFTSDARHDARVHQTILAVIIWIANTCWGDSLLVAPVFSENGDVSVYLPTGRWTHLYH
ncbi:hypothetical protein [Hafnia paralvei]|uniref:hypothetical protein n=1 Tax=Hafnia paralvei TaxID=546367 RepID=UPI003D680E45